MMMAAPATKMSRFQISFKHSIGIVQAVAVAAGCRLVDYNGFPWQEVHLHNIVGIPHKF